MTDAMDTAAGGGRGGEIARMIATLAYVTIATAALLAGLGALPRWIAGDAAVRRTLTLEEAERRLGIRIPLPAYYPQRLAWPPAEVRIAGGRHGSAELHLAARDGGPPVELVISTEAGTPIAPALLEGRTVLGSRPTVVGSQPAALATILLDGVSWHELDFEHEGRAVVLRTRGDLDELFRMAKSMHVEGRR
jgi:hypothetical protein